MEVSPQFATFQDADRNRHPVDELADVRATIRDLQAREAYLKEIVTHLDGCRLEGDDFEAIVTRVEGERIDTAALRKHLGEDGIKPFLKQTSTVTVRIKAIDRSHLAEVEP